MFEDYPILGVLFWAGAVVFFGFLIYVIATSPKCKRGHVERVHHDSYISLMMVGKVMIPQHHPAYDADEFICDERCGKNDPAKECR